MRCRFAHKAHLSSSAHFFLASLSLASLSVTARTVLGWVNTTHQAFGSLVFKIFEIRIMNCTKASSYAPSTTARSFTQMSPLCCHPFNNNNFSIYNIFLPFCNVSVSLRLHAVIQRWLFTFDCIICILESLLLACDVCSESTLKIIKKSGAFNMTFVPSACALVSYTLDSNGKKLCDSKSQQENDKLFHKHIFKFI